MAVKIFVLTGAVVMSLLAPPLVSARPPEIGALQVGQSMRENLNRLSTEGKRVEVVLKSGKSYRGKLGAVGDDAVVITEIEGREFFDALVLIDGIAAVEVRVRDR